VLVSFFLMVYNPILNNLGIVYYVYMEIATTFRNAKNQYFIVVGI